MSQTPLRVSLAGGGTDFKGFYTREPNEPGFVVSTAIDKYVYVIVKERGDDEIWLSYMRKEIVDGVDAIEHDLIREAMKLTGVDRGVEIVTLADIPSEGSGLGSSSAVTVGLLNALYAYQGKPANPDQLAREACRIEIDILGRPIGKQDQYIAAYGGLKSFEFRYNGVVGVQALGMSAEARQELERNLLLFYTGHTRQSATILKEQTENLVAKRDSLLRLRDQAQELRIALWADAPGPVGRALREGWQEKRGLASQVSNRYLDGLVERAVEAGALGAKIAGAGGGGYLLGYVPHHNQDAVREALCDLKELPFRLEPRGSRIILDTGRN